MNQNPLKTHLEKLADWTAAYALSHRAPSTSHVWTVLRDAEEALRQDTPFPTPPPEDKLFPTGRKLKEITP